MKPVIVVLALAVSSVIACGDNAYRCGGCGGAEKDYGMTKYLADEQDVEMCFCFHALEYYADMTGRKAEQFQLGCFRMGCNKWLHCGGGGGDDPDRQPLTGHSCSQQQ
ncbi:MAG: hypothetical protein J3Q66DRAFT_1107 [Benniella sp.]|nr:MAG: hypothetical protein J3Q66DRAFT_1107 [Benniella sp.]